MAVGVEDIVVVEDVVCGDEVVEGFCGRHHGGTNSGGRVTRSLE